MSFTEAFMIITINVMVLGIPLLAIYRGMRKDKMLSEERKMAIEKGIALPEFPENNKSKTDPMVNLRSGIISLGTGLAIFIVGILLMTLFVVEQWLVIASISLGLVVSGFGGAKLYFYSLARKAQLEK